jgi:hypothetical protein
MSPKQIWSWHLVVREPSHFLTVTWCREALYGLGVQGVEALIPLGGFFSVKCGSSVSARFFIHGAHAVCFCNLVGILGPVFLIITYVCSPTKLENKRAVLGGGKVPQIMYTHVSKCKSDIIK